MLEFKKAEVRFDIKRSSLADQTQSDASELTRITTGALTGYEVAESSIHPSN